MTGNGANAKEAVSAKLPWQDNVNAVAHAACQEPPLCKNIIAGPSCLMGTKASKRMGNHHKRNKVRRNKEETGSAVHFKDFAELRVHRKGGTPELRRMHTE